MVPAASGSDPASKKAEIRARRFGARDKAKKLSAVIPPGGGAAAAAARVGSEGSGGGGAGEEPVAQSLQALTRRGEAVVEDLEKTQAGLAELELEEAEEAGEAALAEGGGDGGSSSSSSVVADPLDMFMSENRKKERQQAMLRLTAKRDALLEEQARLKVMTEAARPSMPSLKTSAPAATATATAAAAEAAGADASTKDGAESNGAVGVVSSSPLDRGTDAKPDPTAGRKEGTGSTAVSDRRQVSKSGGGDVKIKAIEGEEKEEGKEEGKEERLPPPDPVSPSSPMPVAVNPRRSPAGSQREACAQSGGGESDKIGAPKPNPTEIEAGKKVSGAKRRGTPVGASMLPPPPAKRPQQRRDETVAPAAAPAGEGSVRVGRGGSLPSPSRPTAKRKIKGPAAMPSPLGKPSALSAGTVASSEGKTAGRSTRGAAGGEGAGKATGKDVLEGGDVDWVPPKNALEKMAALNRKFGY